MPERPLNQTAFKGFIFKWDMFFPPLYLSWNEIIIANSFLIPVPKHLKVRYITCGINEMSSCSTLDSEYQPTTGTDDLEGVELRRGEGKAAEFFPRSFKELVDSF